MQLAFNQVSFAYDAQLARKAKKGKSNHIETGADSTTKTMSTAFASAAPANAAGPSAPDASVPGASLSNWGNNPSNPWALQDISFTVNEGDFVGIAGHTGSGKSTLLQHMNGLLLPTQGTVTFNGKSLAEKNARKSCRSAVGVVFQYPERQLFAATVFDDVAFGPRNMKLPEEEVRRRVCASLEAVRLSASRLGESSPFELSGGQQRRVAFAGVLAMNPQILVLDEPTAGLDPEAKQAFLDLVAQLHTRGMTIVMVSHNMDDLAQLCNRILVLNQGCIVLQGNPEQVFSQEEQLHAMGLGVPHAQRMANRLRERGVALPPTFFADAADLAQACASLYRSSKSTAGEKAAGSKAPSSSALSSSVSSKVTPHGNTVFDPRKVRHEQP